MEYLKQKDVLWAKVIKKRYEGDNGFPMEKKVRKLHIWRNMVEEGKLMLKRLIKRAGNGRTIKFWTNPWVLQKPIINSTIKEVPQEEYMKKVSDYCINEN